MNDVLLLTMEERKPIPGVPNYSITRTGRVFSEPRVVKCGKGYTRRTPAKELTTSHSSWYRESGQAIRLRVSGRQHTFWVHKLVRDAFR